MYVFSSGEDASFALPAVCVCADLLRAAEGANLAPSKTNSKAGRACVTHVP